MAKINTFVTLLKILAIIFIVTVGLVAISRRGHFTDDIQHPFRGSSVTSAADVGGLALALYSVLWAYSGWENFVCTVEEMKKPERTLPRAMVMGVIIVSLCYFFVNLSFFSILSNDEIVGTQAVALTFGEAVLGKAGLVVFPLLVAVSTLGTNLLNIYVSSRMIFSSAREQQFPEVFCGVHEKWGTPISAVILQACMTAIYISVGDIGSLIQGLSAAQWVFICLAFVSVLIMRFTHKDDHRPFKVWWIVPVIMVVVSVFLIFLPLTTAPGLSLAAFGIILSGVPVYFIFVMERPWKLRPAFLDTCSDIITKYGNRVLQAKSARTV
jgi:L-type amino acid transporter 9